MDTYNAEMHIPENVMNVHKLVQRLMEEVQHFYTQTCIFDVSNKIVAGILCQGGPLRKVTHELHWHNASLVMWVMVMRMQPQIQRLKGRTIGKGVLT
jgi:hypothetical protein